MRFLVYLYYTQPSYQTSTFGQNHAYRIRIFTVRYLFQSICYVLIKVEFLPGFTFSFGHVHLKCCQLT